MTEETPVLNENGEPLSKAQLKKLAKEREKAERKAANEAAQAALQYEPPKLGVLDLQTAEFGDMPLHMSQGQFLSLPASSDGFDAPDGPVCISAFLQNSRCTSKSAFVLLREQTETIEGVCFDDTDKIKYIKSIPRESYVYVEGTIEPVEESIKTCTIQHREIKIHKIFCITRAVAQLPLLVEDAMRPDSDVSAVKPLRETLYDNRVIDLRTPANKGIFVVRARIQEEFSSFMINNGFLQITSPKINPGASEGGASVFTLNYFDRPACLAQSPELYKEMAIASGFERVFEIGPVFRAEKSHTHRHLCEFTGLDLEMEIKESYREVLCVLDKLMKHIFGTVLSECDEQIKIIREQYDVDIPSKLVWTEEMVTVDFEEGCRWLKEAGIDQSPLEDLSTETERELGRIVREKFNTDFYILTRFPAAARPFYTMPDHENPEYSNSFDMFIRGQEICSGAQRIHDPEFLEQEIIKKGIDPDTLRGYIEAFAYGCPPHGGAGLGLERIVMLVLGIEDCRQCCMFPRTPERLTP